MLKKLLCSIIFLTFTLIDPALAQTTEKSENGEITVGGVKVIGSGYEVFPDGKMGNTVYKDRQKLVSRSDLILSQVVEAPEGHVYYGVTESDQAVLGYVGNEKVEFNQLPGNFYELINANGQRKLYRVNSDSKIQNLLPKSNTASGLVYNDEDKAAFFHITKGELIELEDGRQKYQYTFKIHVVRDDSTKVIHLTESVSDFKPRLKMAWADKNTLQYTLSNDQQETIVIE